jgi:hypothetical protein
VGYFKGQEERKGLDFRERKEMGQDMRVLIYNGQTGLYFKAPGAWTEEKNDAFVFADRSTAIKFYETHYLPGARIVAVDQSIESSSELGTTEPPRNEETQ